MSAHTNARPDVRGDWNGNKNGWRTMLFHVERGNEAAVLKQVGGGAIWTDNHGQPIGISFGGSIPGHRREFAKYGHFVCIQCDTQTGEYLHSVVNEANVRYIRRQHGEPA